MSVPTQRRTSSFTKRRRSHQALSSITHKECEKCKKPVLPHRVCQNCGSYKGKTVIDKTKKKK